MQVILDRLDRIEAALRGGDKPRWLKFSSACKYADISPNTLRKWINKGLIYGTKTTGEWRVDRESIDDFFNVDRF